MSEMERMNDKTFHVNDGQNGQPRLAVFANEWALGELPRRPAAETWSFEECLDRVAAAGYDGVQCGVAHVGSVRRRGLRFCTSGRVNSPGEVDPMLHAAADAGADCITLHAGWGMETEDEADAFADAIVSAAARHRVPTYVETHRATMTQDVFRTCRLLERHPELLINGDFSHFYCGQELGYRGFDITRAYLAPIIDRTRFLHGRISDGHCMQCDISDPTNAKHVANFVWLWANVMRSWLSRATAGDVLIFAPELGPPSSGYSISVRDASGRRVEVCDRWQQSLDMAALARRAFAEASA